MLLLAGLRQRLPTSPRNLRVDGDLGEAGHEGVGNGIELAGGDLWVRTASIRVRNDTRRAGRPPDRCDGGRRAPRPPFSHVQLSDARPLGRGAAAPAPAGGDELRALLRDLGDELDVPAAQAVLRNPHAGEEVVRLLAAERRLLASYEMRRDWRSTPRRRSRCAVAGRRALLARPRRRRSRRAHPAGGAPLRRATAIERLPGLAVGEKTSIARSASPHVLQALRHDPTPRVIAAMLDNPRLVEGDLLPLASGEAAPTPVLAVILGHRKWGSRYPVRLAVRQEPARAPPTGAGSTCRCSRSPICGRSPRPSPGAAAAPQGRAARRRLGAQTPRCQFARCRSAAWGRPPAPRGCPRGWAGTRFAPRR